MHHYFGFLCLNFDVLVIAIITITNYYSGERNVEKFYLSNINVTYFPNKISYH